MSKTNIIFRLTWRTCWEVRGGAAIRWREFRFRIKVGKVMGSLALFYARLSPHFTALGQLEWKFRLFYLAWFYLHSSVYSLGGTLSRSFKRFLKFAWIKAVKNFLPFVCDRSNFSDKFGVGWLVIQSVFFFCGSKKVTRVLIISFLAPFTWVSFKLINCYA